MLEFGSRPSRIAATNSRSGNGSGVKIRLLRGALPYL
jgi:hypothetical protein